MCTLECTQLADKSRHRRRTSKSPFIRSPVRNIPASRVVIQSSRILCHPKTAQTHRQTGTHHTSSCRAISSTNSDGFRQRVRVHTNINTTYRHPPRPTTAQSPRTHHTTNYKRPKTIARTRRSRLRDTHPRSARIDANVARRRHKTQTHPDECTHKHTSQPARTRIILQQFRNSASSSSSSSNTQTHSHKTQPGVDPAPNRGQCDNAGAGAR